MDKTSYRLFFQKSSEYYLEKLEKFEQGKKITFNLYAFLFSYIWLLRRKMYGTTIAFAILMSIETILIEYILKDQFSSEFFEYYNFYSIIIYNIFLGFVVNYLYLNKAKKVVTSIQHLNDHEKEIHLKKYGVNSYGKVFLYLILFLIIVILIFTAVSYFIEN